MLTALIIIYVVFVIWKLTPVVFRALEIRKQFKADVEIMRQDMQKRWEKETAEAKKKADDDHKEHTKRLEESISHGGRVQYPWVSGIRTNLDSETNKESINMRGELVKKDHEAQYKERLRRIFNATAEAHRVKYDPKKKTRTFKDKDGNVIVERFEDVSKKTYEEEGP